MKFSPRRRSHRPAAAYLNDDAVTVYSWILRHQQVTKRDCVAACHEMNLTEEETAGAVGTLQVLGLLRPHTKDADLLVPVDPDLAAAALAAPVRESVHEQQRRLTQISVEFSRLRSHFLEGGPRRAEAVEVIPHPPDVRAALDHASAECRGEALSSLPGGDRSPEALQETLTRDTALLARGVRMRTLYHHTARFHGPSQAYVAVASGLGAECRTTHDPFGRLILFDHDLAFLPGREGTGEAVLVRDRAVVGYLRSVFESAWTHARPFSDAASDGLEAVAKELDGTILRLLAEGCKDETISRRLGMSLRTTRKHIAGIMASLGADSRFQAGVLAARAGLLTEGDPALPHPPELENSRRAAP